MASDPEYQPGFAGRVFMYFVWAVCIALFLYWLVAFVFGL